MIRRLRNDPFSRRVTTGIGRVRVSLTGIVLLALSAGLLVLSRIDHDVVRQTRAMVSAWTLPLVVSASLPLAPVRRLVDEMSRHASLAEQNARLEAENQQLKGWQWRARELEQRLAALAPLARVVPEQPLPFLTARVVAHSIGPFVRVAMIGAGAEQGLRKGLAVIDGGGLVGRLVDVGATASHVLLVTDLQSRIPVEIGPGRTRAIMIGDNSHQPRLEFVQREAVIAPGEDVATSGAAGGVPKGLRVGKVVAGDDGPRVIPAARMGALDYVSVLIVETEVIDTSEHRVSSGTGEAGLRGLGAKRKAPAAGGKP